MKSTIFTILLLFVGEAVFATAYHLEVSWPIQRMIFQRDATNKGTIEVAGIAYKTTVDLAYGSPYLVTESVWPGDFTIEAKLEKLNLSDGSLALGSPIIDWTSYSNLISNPSIIKGRFLISISNIPGGWYKLSLRVKDSGGVVRATNEVSRVGVGDVFVIAGQSNAEGTSETGGYDTSDPVKESALSSFSYWDGVNSVNAAFDSPPSGAQFPSSATITKISKDSRIAPTGENAWCWGALGYLIASNKNVPVLFFNAASGGTPSRAWSESSSSTSTPNPWLSSCGTNSYYPTDFPFINLRNALSTYGNTFGVRAVLWHQGETDTHWYYDACFGVGTYSSNLNNVISNSRTKFNGSLGWVISKASKDFDDGVTTETNAAIISQQTTVGTQPGWYTVGPATDAISPRNSDSNGDRVHFKNDQLDKVAVEWYNALTSDDVFNSSNISPIAPAPLMKVGVSASGSNFILTPTTPSGFTSEQDWDTSFAGIDYSSSDVTSSSSLTVPNDPFARYYRTAYFSNSNLNTRISVPFRRLGSFFSNSSSGYRVAGKLFFYDEIAEGETAANTYKVYPNPSSSNITIEGEGSLLEETQLEIYNEEGQNVYSLVKGSLSSGSVVIPDEVFKKTGFYYSKAFDGKLSIVKRFYIEK